MEATVKGWAARPDDVDADRGALTHWFVGRLAEGLNLEVPDTRSGDHPATAPPPATPPRVEGALVPDVVVVEDDPALAELLEYGLRSRGYHFASFRNGREALDHLLALDTGSRHPLLLLDVDLPALDGYSIFAALQRERPGTYRVVLPRSMETRASNCAGSRPGRSTTSSSRSACAWRSRRSAGGWGGANDRPSLSRCRGGRTGRAPRRSHHPHHSQSLVPTSPQSAGASACGPAQFRHATVGARLDGPWERAGAPGALADPPRRGCAGELVGPSPGRSLAAARHRVARSLVGPHRAVERGVRAVVEAARGRALLCGGRDPGGYVQCSQAPA